MYELKCWRALASLFAVALVIAPSTWAAKSSAYDVTEKSLIEIERDLTAGRITSERLVDAYLARIAALDRKGPRLRSVISVNPDAKLQARRLDQERRNGKVRSRLHGIPVMLKDNIESADRMPTTAGSTALRNNQAVNDSALAARLRAAGAIILAKTNLSNWADMQSMNGSSGWSPLGGLVKNPYALDRTACGSSAGSGAAIAASLAAAAIGTETDGSIICPSAMQGLVGLKPTVGLISRRGLIPISRAQDSAGPMARSVADLAEVLTILAGTDPSDPATLTADQHTADYSAAVSATTLTGRRFGVLQYATGNSAQTDIVFAAAIATLKQLGAQIVELEEPEVSPATRTQELSLMLAEFKTNLDQYLQRTPAGVPVKSLAALIAYNKNGSRDVELFGQDLLEAAQASEGADSARQAQMSRDLQQLAGADGIDRLLTKNHLDALIAPSTVPAGRTDLIRGDPATPDASRLPAIAGYPHLTVPMGTVRGLPVGISFIGTAWSERALLAYGAAFEHATHARRAPRFPPSLDTTGALGELAEPIKSR